MSRCPVCESAQIVIVLSSRPRDFCPQCGTWWTQEGSEQRNIIQADRVPVMASHPSELDPTIPSGS
jgi:Zn-finger nucleic acid-binding protein